MMNDE